MFRVRKDQIAAFEEANVGAFCVEMAQHLRDVLPEAVARFDDEALIDSLRTRLGQALSYGITDRFDALRYLECSYALGWVDNGPDDEAHAVLAQNALSAEDKVDIIEKRTEST